MYGWSTLILYYGTDTKPKTLEIMYSAFLTVLKVMEQKIQEYESKNDLIEKENSLLKKKIEIVTKQKSDLEIHNTEVLTELDNSVKKQQLVDEKLKTAQSYFTSQEHDMNEKLLRLDKEHKCEVCSLQTKIKEQSTILKEYQDKVI